MSREVITVQTLADDLVAAMEVKHPDLSPVEQVQGAYMTAVHDALVLSRAGDDAGSKIWRKVAVALGARREKLKTVEVVR